MAAPSSVADLLDLVRQSLPLDPSRLDSYVAELRHSAVLPAKPQELAGLLVRDGFLTAFQADHLMRGRRPKFLIGKYVILDRLGAGGMGAVYLCEHLQLERLVALKVLPADQAEDPGALARFIREAQAVAALNHPNIVRAYDVDVEGKTYFLVMEYVDGVNLQDLVTRHGRLDPTRAAHYISQSAEGLQHAHQAGLVHRDIKPANLLLSRTGVVKVLDLGLARFFHDDEDALTKEHSGQAILGTADYLSPEQGRNSHNVDIRADLYSLGATFYFLLVGRAPFADGTLNQKLIRHQMKTPTAVRKLRPDVPEAMAMVISRMMAKDAAGRYQTPADVVAALAPWTQTVLRPPAPAELPPLRPTARAGRRGRNVGDSAGSTVVNRASRTTALSGPPAAAPAPLASIAAMLNLQLPLAPPRTVTTSSPALIVAPSAPPAAPQAPLPQSGDDWSRLFDDDSGAGKPSAPSGGRRPGKRHGLDVRKHGWYFAGAIPALLLLVGGVWLAVSLVPGAPKPAAAPPGQMLVLPEKPRGPVNLRATAKGTDAIELTWEDPNGPSESFRVTRATDRYFTKNLVMTSVPKGNARVYTDSGLASGATYYYRMRAIRESGESTVSNVAWTPLDYSQGFTPIGLVLNRGAVVIDKALRLTDASANEARSAFYQTEIDVRSFTTRFRFKISPGNTADGFTFCIHGGEPTAVGAPAGGLGYQGVPNSVAVKFDLFSNEGEGPNTTGVYLNGDKPTNAGAIDLTPSGIDLHSGRTYDATIDYKDKKLTLNITDVENPAKKFSRTFDVDVPATVHGSTAYVGFTGGTGEVSAIQDILSWTWQSNAPAD
jgi:serine/threonine protein kinase